MKKVILLTFILCIYCAPNVFSQSVEHKRGDFSKIIEYNLIGITTYDESDRRYNLESKSILDRIFFGNINSPVEFIRRNYRGAYAFRIVKKPNRDSYFIEVMYMPEPGEVERIVKANYSEINAPTALRLQMGLKVREQIDEHNKIKVHRNKIDGDGYESYRPEVKKKKVSKDLMEAIRKEIIFLVDNFKGKGPTGIIVHGTTTTFRCVVDDELWTLRVRGPQARALQSSDILKQLIDDIQNDKFDESKYLDLLR